MKTLEEIAAMPPGLAACKALALWYQVIGKPLLGDPNADLRLLHSLLCGELGRYLRDLDSPEFESFATRVERLGTLPTRLK